MSETFNSELCLFPGDAGARHGTVANHLLAGCFLRRAEMADSVHLLREDRRAGSPTVFLPDLGQFLKGQGILRGTWLTKGQNVRGRQGEQEHNSGQTQPAAELAD